MKYVTMLGLLVGWLLVGFSGGEAAYTMKRSGFFMIPYNYTLTRAYRCPTDVDENPGRYVQGTGRAYWMVGGELEDLCTGVRIRHREELANGYRATITNRAQCSFMPPGAQMLVALVIEIKCRYPGEPDTFPLLLMEGEIDGNIEDVLGDEFLNEWRQEERD